MTKKKCREEAKLNKLLDALPNKEFNKVCHLLEPVDLEFGEVLWHADEERKFVYFPTTAMVCFFYETEEGISIEVGMTGRQGMVGVVTFMGDSRMAKRAVVQREGRAFQIKAADVETAFALSPDFQEVCMFYTQTLIAQLSQNAICNRLHTVEQQICRYLLFTRDALQDDAFHLTHEQMANVLGVRRESVSLAAGNLRDSGLIEYSRGNLAILDRKALLAAACECYKVVTDQYERILHEYKSRNGD